MGFVREYKRLVPGDFLVLIKPLSCPSWDGYLGVGTAFVVTEVSQSGLELFVRVRTREEVKVNFINTFSYSTTVNKKTLLEYFDIDNQEYRRKPDGKYLSLKDIYPD